MTSTDTSGTQDMGSFGISDPTSVNLDTTDPRDIICYLNAPGNDEKLLMGARISAIFVVLVTSTCVTLFPVLAVRARRLKIPKYFYLFARYFGAGVIIATAFIHLLEPAYEEIGPATCVGMTAGWSEYSWPPALALFSAMMVFLMDFAAERYVEKKYGFSHGPDRQGSVDMAMQRYAIAQGTTFTGGHQHLHSGDQDNTEAAIDPKTASKEVSDIDTYSLSSQETERAFRQQIAAFLILEFGVLFHSVIIGLALGTAGDEFATLYVVIVFHQAFEGLGIGARLSAIPFPKHLHWLPWFLCISYGLCTPISIAIGLGVRNTYSADGFTASIVSGILDSLSAGILLYTGFVELLARDFLFNPNRTQNDRELTFMVCCVLLGCALMALLGKWA